MFAVVGVASFARVLASALCLSGALLVSCGGKTSADEPQTRLLLRSREGLTVVTFSDPHDVRATLLTDRFWPNVLTEPGGSPGIDFARSPDERSVAWADQDDTVGAYIDGRVVLAPLEGLTEPQVSFVANDIVRVSSPEGSVSWRPRTGEIVEELMVSCPRDSSALNCCEGVVTFTSASGDGVTWDESRAFFVQPSGERVALVVAEAGDFDPALVDEIVLPDSETGALDCESESFFNPGSYYGPVEWSASGRLLAAQLDGEPRLVRIGSPPLDEADDHVELTGIDLSSAQPWAFMGEDLYWIADNSVEEVRELRVRDETGHVSVVTRSEPGEVFFSITARASGHGLALWVIDGESGDDVIYVVAEDGTAVRLVVPFDGRGLSPEPAGPGLLVRSQEVCPGSTAICLPRDLTLFWPDPDGQPGDFWEFEGTASWLKNRRAFLVDDDTNLWFVSPANLDAPVLLAPASEVMAQLMP